MKQFGSWTELVSLIFRKNGQTITLRPNQATTYTSARDIQSPPQDADSILVSTDATQTLTNKTLTSPAITSPTGITKSDVGLSNVDNTSDATKNSASVTLTNKTLTSPVINTPTGIVKGDVGLGNVDNTSDATKNAAAVQLTNKDIDGGTASNTSRITIPKASTSTLTALTRKQGTVLYDTTTDQLKYDNGSSLTALAAASLTDYANLIDNLALATSVGSNALTISLKTKGAADPSSGSPTQIGFRNSTAATGTYNVRSATAATSLVISSGSTLGHSSGSPSWIYVYALDNAGTIELAASSSLFDQSSVITTTAEGGAGAADSISVMYSTTARTSVPFRFIGRLKSTQTAAGTWVANMTEVTTNTVAAFASTDIVNEDDIVATKYGRKAYLADKSGGTNDTAYNGGNKATIVLSAGGGSLTSVDLCQLIPYQLQDGTWRLKINTHLTLSSTSRTEIDVTVNGITFSNLGTLGQGIWGCSNGSGGTVLRSFANPNSNTLVVVHTSATTSEYVFSGDVALTGKPSWAY